MDILNYNQVNNILEDIKDVSILVIGDYFLDKYLYIDPEKSITSLETGLEANQVYDKKLEPGAAGTVTDNLAALQTGDIKAIGFIGRDGEGFELKQGLKKQGVNIEDLIETEQRYTPAYIKPLLKKENSNNGIKFEESNRIDIRNWEQTLPFLQEKIIENLKANLKQADGVVILDQVYNDNTGVITEKIRKKLGEIGKKRDDIFLLADSRASTNKFRNVMIKCNHYEIVNAFYPEYDREPDLDIIKECGKKMEQRNNKPVFITRGKKGQVVINQGQVVQVPGIEVEGPLDIVGAGDAATAGIILALSSGSNLQQAAMFGNLIASITVKKLATTGTASPREVIKRIKEIENNNPPYGSVE